MKINAIRLRNIRMFGAQGAAIEDISNGLSMLATANERGKTTIFEALRIVLFERAGTAKKEVKSLASTEGAAPLIEIDFFLEGKRYRLKKQYLKKPQTELTDLANGQLLLMGDDAHDWMCEKIGAAKAGEGPTGLLWVEQGKSMLPPDVGTSGRSLLEDLLEHQISDITGGERARNLLDRTTEELALMITKTGKPKTHTEYKSELDRCEELRDDLEYIQGQLDNSESLLQELNHLNRSIKDLENPENMKQIDYSLEQARTDLEKARVANERIMALKSNLVDKSEVTERLEKEINKFRKSKKEIENLDSVFESLNSDHDTAVKKYNQKNREVGDLNKEYERINKDLEKNETILNLCRKNAELEKNKKEIGELEKILDDAEKIAVECSKLEVKLSANKATKQKIKSIQNAELQYEKTKLALEFQRPLMKPDLTTEGESTVKLDGKPLSDEIHLSGSQEISLGNLGKIAFETYDSADLKKDFDSAEAKLNKLLSSIGCADLQSARQAGEKREILESDFQKNTAKLETIAPNGLGELRDKFTQLSAFIDEANQSNERTEKLPEIQIAEENFEKVRSQHNSLRTKLRSAEKDRMKLRDEVVDLKDKINKNRAQYDPLIEVTGKSDQWEQREQNIVGQLEKAKQEEEKILEKISKAKEGVSVEAAEIKVNRLEKSKTELQSKLSNQRERRSSVVTELDIIASEGPEELRNNLAEQLESSKERIDAFEHRIKVLQLIQKELEYAQSTLLDKFLKPVSDELRPLLNIVLPGTNISLGGDFIAEKISRSGREEPISSLSGGTQEQIAVLTRLAFAKLMADRGHEMPVILDDALVWCDDERIENVFSALNKAAEDIQCIVLTCHERAFQTLGAPQLEIQPW